MGMAQVSSLSPGVGRGDWGHTQGEAKVAAAIFNQRKINGGERVRTVSGEKIGHLWIKG